MGKTATPRPGLPWARIAALAATGVISAAAGILVALAIFGAPGQIALTDPAPESQPAQTGQFIEMAAPEALPGFAFKDANGVEKHLSDWRGQAVLLNIWATWCAPCKAEMPALDRLQARLSGGDFTVIALSTDRSGPGLPTQFFQSGHITHLDVYNDPASAAIRTLQAEGLPFSVLIDKEGRAVARLLGPADWDAPEVSAKLRELLRVHTGQG